MATTDTTITVTPSNFPLIGYNALDGFANYIPRSELLFKSGSTAVTVAGAGEDQRILASCILPRGWAYVFLEATMRMDNPDVADWDDCAGLELSDSIADPNFLCHMTFCNPSGEISHGSTAQFWKSYYVHNPVNKVFLCDGADDGRLRIILMNTTIDGTAGSVHIYARFARFDLNQAHHFAVSAPMPVRG